MQKTLMLFAMLLLAACAREPSLVMIPPANCAALIPPGIKQGVAAAPIPQNDARLASWVGGILTPDIAAAIIAPWATGFVEQSGRLEIAVNNTATVTHIVETCEANANAARPENRD
jgi:hypothetical protein